MFFDGDDAYQEYSVSGERTAEYMFSGRIDEPLLVTKGGQEYTYHQNHLGTVMGLSGADESLVNEYEYTAYGMDRGSAEIVDQPYQYTAREKIGDTGLHYYRSRVMRSGNGGFTREDDAMDGVNWRGYVGGDPIIFKDPTGKVISVFHNDTGNTVYVASLNKDGTFSFEGVPPGETADMIDADAYWDVSEQEWVGFHDGIYSYNSTGGLNGLGAGSYEFDPEDQNNLQNAMQEQDMGGGDEDNNGESDTGGNNGGSWNDPTFIFPTENIFF